MLGQPLKPFHPPVSVNAFMPGGISIPFDSVLHAVFYIVLLFWAGYTLIAIYHWLKYSHGSFVAYPAIGLHLGVSLVLILYVLSGIVTI